MSLGAQTTERVSSSIAALPMSMEQRAAEAVRKTVDGASSILEFARNVQAAKLKSTKETLDAFNEASLDALDLAAANASQLITMANAPTAAFAAFAEVAVPVLSDMFEEPVSMVLPHVENIIQVPAFHTLIDFDIKHMFRLVQAFQVQEYHKMCEYTIVSLSYSVLNSIIYILENVRNATLAPEIQEYLQTHVSNENIQIRITHSADENAEGADFPLSAEVIPLLPGKFLVRIRKTDVPVLLPFLFVHLYVFDVHVQCVLLQTNTCYSYDDNEFGTPSLTGEPPKKITLLNVNKLDHKFMYGYDDIAYLMANTS